MKVKNRQLEAIKAEILELIQWIEFDYSAQNWSIYKKRIALLTIEKDRLYKKLSKGTS